MLDDENAIRALLYLHRLIGQRPVPFARLLSDFGSAEAVLSGAHPGLLEEMRYPPAVIQRLFQAEKPSRRRIEADLEWLGTSRHQLVLLGDANYPALLKSTHDPPPLLFADGDPGLLATDQFAMVGSRKLSMSGRKHAIRIASDLARAGLTVTSGLALGIDAAAHAGALEAEGSTVAVMGCGCDIDYPASNRRLATRIRASGVVVSELPLGTPAEARHFPQRNRIVTGMSLGTLVVEAALKSGSLISAKLAAEQGREVFAIPGSIDGPHYEGCHRLIRDGAKLTTSAADVLEELPGYEPARCEDAKEIPVTGEKRTLVTLMGADPVTVDELTEHSGLAVTDVMIHLVEMEVAGIIGQEGGGYILAGAFR